MSKSVDAGQANVFKKANKSSAKDDDTSEMNLDEFRVRGPGKAFRLR